MTGIEIRDIWHSYRTKEGILQVLEGINLRIDHQEFVCVVGPSGCGKSTLLYIVDSLRKARRGEVIFYSPSGGVETGSRANLVFQQDPLLPWRTVRDNVAWGLEIRGVPKEERYRIVSHWIEKVGLKGFENRYPKELSGGMRQRVSIARVLANDPEVILMDEPFISVDAQTRTMLQMDLLRLWQEERKTVLFVTHDIDEAIFLADRVVVMTARPGRLKDVLQVDIPRPRTMECRSSARFGELRMTIWKYIEEEGLRARELGEP